MRIVDYETLGADELSNLDHEVKQAIDDGWQPFGSIAIAATERIDEVYYIYVQTMVRYD